MWFNPDKLTTRIPSEASAMSDTIQNAIDYLQETRDNMLEDYKQLLAFPSIGADPAHDADVQACADWIVAELRALGFDNCEAVATGGHPVVYGEWLRAGADKPTVLVYAHYDVQPVDPLPLWDSEPFTGTIRAGRMYARGASDNKAGVWGNLKTLEALLRANGELPVNVKIMFEGEEESGSPSIEAFVAANKERLSADVLLNCDGDLQPDAPQLVYAGRGIVSAEVRVTGPSADIHSGLYGGIVQNPLHVAGQIIGSLHDDAGRVCLPGYYDALQEASPSEKARIAAGFDADSLSENAGVSTFWGESIAPAAERATVYPTLDVNGMWGGYQGPGSKTIIPAEGRLQSHHAHRARPRPDHRIAAAQKPCRELRNRDGAGRMRNRRRGLVLPAGYGRTLAGSGAVGAGSDIGAARGTGAHGRQHSDPGRLQSADRFAHHSFRLWAWRRHPLAQRVFGYRQLLQRAGSRRAAVSQFGCGVTPRRDSS